LVIVFSSVIASFASRSLRAMPEEPELSRASASACARCAGSGIASAASISTFFTYCCVSVEAPSFCPIRVFTAARAMPCTSIPACS
jgi:hypothetical protein